MVVLNGATTVGEVFGGSVLTAAFADWKGARVAALNCWEAGVLDSVSRRIKWFGSLLYRHLRKKS